MSRKKPDSLLATVGTDGADHFRPGVGVEWNLPNEVDGGAGNDTIMGGKFADTIVGGDGADLIDGMGGEDVLTGGAGADVFKMHSWAYGGDTITDFESGADKIDLSNYSFYEDTNGDGTIGGVGDVSRDLTFADLTWDGTVLGVPSGYPQTTWDDHITILGDAPVASDFLF